MKCKHASITAEDQLPRSNEILCESQANESTLVPSAESVDKEVECVEILETTRSVERRQGSDVRKSINNRFKAHAIALVERGEKAIDVADRLSVTRGQNSKWLKIKDKISNAAVDETKKMLTRLAYPSKKYNELYKALNLKFLDGRSKGRRVDFNWLWSKARVIYKEQQNNEDADVKKHVIVNFIKRYHLKLRRVQRRKKKPKEAFRESLMKWHSTLREHLIKTKWRKL